MPAAFRAADVILCPSEALRQRLLGLGLDPARVLRRDLGLPPSCAPERRTAASGPALRFGFVGSIVPHKGLHVLLEAFQGLAERGATLDIFGPFEPERDAYHRSLADRRVAGARFRGAFAAAAVDGVYSQFDTLVVPSLWFENAPLVVREAFRARVPVVASDLGGLSEAVRTGVDGLLVPPGDAAALRRTLQRFIDEPQLGSELAARCPSVRTIADDAAETEHLYRALSGAERDTRLPARPYWIPTPRRVRAGVESSPTLEEVRA